MNGWVIALMVLGILALDLLIVTVVLRAFVANAWAPLAQRYPRQNTGPDPTTRRFQSFRFGTFNLGNSVHVTADRRFLHLDPAWIARVIGAAPMSIPRSGLGVIKARGRSALVRVGDDEFWCPAWCVDSAAPGS